MREKLEISKCQRDFLLNGKSIKTKEGEKWFYFPFYLKETNEIDVYEMVSWDKLPEGLKKYIENERNKK
jgi:hypothetical protein